MADFYQVVKKYKQKMQNFSMKFTMIKKPCFRHHALKFTQDNIKIYVVCVTKKYLIGYVLKDLSLSYSGCRGRRGDERTVEGKPGVQESYGGQDETSHPGHDRPADRPVPVTGQSQTWSRAVTNLQNRRQSQMWTDSSATDAKTCANRHHPSYVITHFDLSKFDPLPVTYHIR